MGLFDLFRKKKENHRPTAPVVICAPVSGTVIPMDQVSDEAFASGAMGWCCGIAPDTGVITSPFTGDIMQVADTYHALGVDGDNGVQVVLHVGMDTAEMHGDGFQCRVRGGQPVQLGEKLLEVDFEKIRAAGHPDVVVMAILNSDDYEEPELILEGPVVAGEALVRLRPKQNNRGNTGAIK
jgi:glucose-specific phosphotransferase system IIA component